MRRGHWIPANPHTKIPDWHLCVSVWCERDQAAPDEWKLGGWQTRLLAAEAKHDYGKAVDQGDSADQFWGMVQTIAHGAKTLWVWFGRAAVALPALRFTDQVERERFVRRYWVWGDPPVIAQGKLGGERVKLICLENWLSAGELSTSAQGPALDVVCQSVRKILDFVRVEDLGNLRATVGSQALQAFRHLALPGKIGIHTNRAALRLERDCALAQPLRVLRQGKVKGPIYAVDVNAMYPSLMGLYPFPRKLLWSANDLEPWELKKQAETALLIARVSGHDDRGEYAVQRSNRCEWTSDLKQDVLCGPDLDRALWGDCLSHIHSVAAYEGAGVFVKWSEWALALRKRYSTAENAALAPLAKHLTNALWGTFAGHVGRWEPWNDAPSSNKAYGYWYYHCDEGAPIRCRTIAGVTDRWIEDEEPQHSFPALSAFTAAYARYYMAGACAIIGWDNIHYLCADGLHITQEGHKRLGDSGLVHQSEPGKFKVRGVHKECTYHAANVYARDGVWTVSGRPAGAEEVGPGTWQFTAVQSLTHAIMAPSRGTVQTVRRTIALD